MTFWDRLKEQIKKENTTQDWVANQINVSYRTFNGWVTRKIMPNADQVVSIAQVLNTTVEYLVTGKDPKGRNKIRVELDNYLDSFSDEELQRIKGMIEIAFPKKTPGDNLNETRLA